MPQVDVVVVSYNSRDNLRDCVAPLADHDDLKVIVVDNASSDGSLETIADLRVESIQLSTNAGFGSGCNVGWRAGSAALVLFLNPDARMDSETVGGLRDALIDGRAGVTAPRIIDEEGALEWSLRRFPTVASIYGQAMFAHRFLPRAAWVDDVIRDSSVYLREGRHDWASGACLMTRRELLEAVGGFDEEFFLYCEEIDLCRRVTAAGAPLLYIPNVVCVHAGGASAPRAALLPTLAASRIRYARKWFGRAGAAAYTAGVFVNALTHAIFARNAEMRRGHRQSATVALRALIR